MSRYLCASLATILLLSSCNNESPKSQAVSTKAQVSKPRVAVAPAIDNSDHDLSWNLSDEMTYSVFYRLDQKNQFIVTDPQKVKSISRRLQQSNNPFGGDLKWVKRYFAQDDFVVFLEVLKHEESSIVNDKEVNPKDCSANLNMTLRVVVVDIRQQTPEVILQEIVTDTHFIPRQFNKYNFHQASWGTEEFHLSPVGMAHAQFIKDISARVEEYIQLAKSS